MNYYRVFAKICSFIKEIAKVITLSNSIVTHCCLTITIAIVSNELCKYRSYVIC